LVITFPVAFRRISARKKSSRCSSARAIRASTKQAKDKLEVVQDRLRWFGRQGARHRRAGSGDEAGPGQGRCLARAWQALEFSSTLHCAECDISYSEPTPAMFSFNSPLGACDTCRGFGPRHRRRFRPDHSK
jgi:excinuclease ABC subunit A